MGEPILFRRRRPALPPLWARHHLRPRGFSAGQIRLTIWSGLLFGLLAFQATRFWPVPVEPAAPPFATAIDPYAYSRRQRAELEAQESAPESALPAHGAGPAGKGGSVRVVDGDTFVYAGARIRIADIDTPELHGRCLHETALAARATRRLRALLAQGPFELHFLPNGRTHDRYGRELRIVTRNGRSLGDVLVAEGLARTWTGRREPWCR